MQKTGLFIIPANSLLGNFCWVIAGSSQHHGVCVLKIDDGALRDYCKHVKPRWPCYFNPSNSAMPVWTVESTPMKRPPASLLEGAMPNNLRWSLWSTRPTSSCNPPPGFSNLDLEFTTRAISQDLYSNAIRDERTSFGKCCTRLQVPYPTGNLGCADLGLMLCGFIFYVFIFLLKCFYFPSGVCCHKKAA